MAKKAWRLPQTRKEVAVNVGGKMIGDGWCWSFVVHLVLGNHYIIWHILFVRVSLVVWEQWWNVVGWLLCSFWIALWKAKPTYHRHVIDFRNTSYINVDPHNGRAIFRFRLISYRETFGLLSFSCIWRRYIPIWKREIEGKNSRKILHWKWIWSINVSYFRCVQLRPESTCCQKDHRHSKYNPVYK